MGSIFIHSRYIIHNKCYRINDKNIHIGSQFFRINWKQHVALIVCDKICLKVWSRHMSIRSRHQSGYNPMHVNSADSSLLHRSIRPLEFVALEQCLRDSRSQLVRDMYRRIPCTDRRSGAVPNKMQILQVLMPWVTKSESLLGNKRLPGTYFLMSYYNAEHQMALHQHQKRKEDLIN